jgi:hypothetical protein
MNLFELSNVYEPLPNKLYAGGDIILKETQSQSLKNDIVKQRIHQLSDFFPSFFKAPFIQITDYELLQYINIHDVDKLKYSRLDNISDQNKFILFQIRKLEILLQQQKAYRGPLNLN